MVAAPPVLRSKYQEFVEQLEEEIGKKVGDEDDIDSNKGLSNGGESRRGSRYSTISGGENVGQEEEEEKNNKNNNLRPEEDPLHCWVYVHIPEAAFFIEATTGGKNGSLIAISCINRPFPSIPTMLVFPGERKALNAPCYKKVNSLWNVDNYWLSKNEEWRNRSHLDLHSNQNWVKFVADLEGDAVGSSGGGGDCNKRLLSAPHSWLGELEVPKVRTHYFNGFLLYSLIDLFPPKRTVLSSCIALAKKFSTLSA